MTKVIRTQRNDKRAAHACMHMHPDHKLTAQRLLITQFFLEFFAMGMWIAPTWEL